MADLPRNQFLIGNALDVLKTLPDNSVHCCVTSPPYFGLRSYCEEGSLEKQHEIGIESSPEQYIESLATVFRAVKRVLHPSGTVWIVVGDSFNSGTQFNKQSNLEEADRYQEQDHTAWAGHRELILNLKPKDMIGIPWKLAFALRDELGLWLRQDIIWSKPNPLPESVSDRCTKSHEYVFLLSKSHHYYYDAEAIKEPSQTLGSGKCAGTKNHKYVSEYENSNTEEHRTKAGLLNISETVFENRNRRSVWVIPTKSCSETHFAIFPEALITPMILAGTSAKGCCP
jgi:DNA modification methylase